MYCRTVVAPMLESSGKSAFSNFWMDQDSNVSTTMLYGSTHIYMQGTHNIIYTIVLSMYIDSKKHVLTLQGYYKRNEEYMPIRERKWTGCFRAPVVLSVVLVHLASPHSLGLVYYPPPTEYVGPAEDGLLFAFSAKTQGPDFIPTLWNLSCVL